jgi:AcrR family transcriptional regulator
MNDRLDRFSAQPAQTQRFLRKREAVLEAAARVFNEHGVKGATLAEVGRELGLATNSVTYYYKRKEDLASACFLRAIEVQTEVAHAAAAHPALRERVAAFVRGSYAIEQAIVLGERPVLVTYNEIRALPPSHATAVFDAYGAMFRGVRRLLEGSVEGTARGLLNARAHLLLSMANSRSLARRVDPGDITLMAERVCDIVLDGIAGARATWVDDAELGELEAAAGALAASAEPAGPEQDFLRVATQLINEQGFRGASVERISARLNLTKGSFYHHHDNKEDLIGACFERSQAKLRETIAASRAAGGSGWARLARTARRLVRYQLSAQGPLLRMTAVSALPPERRIRVLQTQDRLNEQLRSFVVDGMIDGSIRPVDPAVAAHLVGSMINAAATLPRWAAGLSPGQADRAFARPLLLGIGCQD